MNEPLQMTTKNYVYVVGIFHITSLSDTTLPKKKQQPICKVIRSNSLRFSTTTLIYALKLFFINFHDEYPTTLGTSIHPTNDAASSAHPKYARATFAEFELD